MSADLVDEVAALVDVLWFLPAPARIPVARGMHGLGVRVHPELATSVMISDPDSANLGNHTPRAPMEKRALEFLRATNPELAAKIELAKSDPQLKAKVAAQLLPDVEALRQRGAQIVAPYKDAAP